MNDSSANFRRFHESFFGSREYGWEPDTRALLSLKGEERAAAERLLLDALRNDDREAAFALGELRSTAAIGGLKKSLSAADAGLRVQSALALWKIERFPEAAAVITACLQQSRPSDPIDDEEIDGDLLEFEQVDAICALGGIATPESAAALLNALDHPRSVVRYNAARALSWICGHAREIANCQTALMSDNHAESVAAREAIRSLIDVSSVQDMTHGEFEISFDPMAQEYLVYSEGGKEFHFHPDYSGEPVTIPTGDYLSGILGQARSFQPGERERIMPRLEEFLRRESHSFHLSQAKHRDEPDELKPSIGGKIRFQRMPAFLGGASSPSEEISPEAAELTEEIRYNWVAVNSWLALGAAIFGGVGFLVWGLLSMNFDAFASGWHGLLLSVGGALVGVLLVWRKISR